MLPAILLAGMTFAGCLPQRTPVQDEQVAKYYELHLVDDLGAPLADVAVSLNRVREFTVKKRSKVSIRSVEGAPTRSNTHGRLFVPTATNWNKHYALLLRFEDPLVAGAEFDGLRIPWDGKNGSTTVVVPRPGWIEGQVLSQIPKLARLGRQDDFHFESDATGHFRVGPVAPGHWTFELHCGLAFETVTADVAPGETVVVPTIDLNQGGWIVGHGLEASGDPLDCGAIRLGHPGSGVSAWINEPMDFIEDDGGFALGPLPAGTEFIQLLRGKRDEDGGSVDPRSPAVAGAWVEVPHAGVVQVDLRSPSPPIAVVGVATFDGKPLANASIALRVSGPWHGESTTADAEGRFEILAPCAGAYELVVSRQNPEPLTASRIGPFTTDIQVTAGGNPVTVHPDLPRNSLQIPALAKFTRATLVHWESNSEHSILLTRQPILTIEGLTPGTYYVTTQSTRMAEATVTRTSHTTVLWNEPPTEPFEVALPKASLDIHATRSGLPVVPEVRLFKGHTMIPSLYLYDEVRGPGLRHLERIPPSTYTLAVRARGGAWVRRSVALDAGDEVLVELRLP